MAVAYMSRETGGGSVLLKDFDNSKYLKSIPGTEQIIHLFWVSTEPESLFRRRVLQIYTRAVLF